MADFQAELSPLPSPEEVFGKGVPFHVETYGCQMNSYDSQAITGILAGSGFQRVPSVLEAQIVLLNTCSVRDHAEQKILSRIGEIRQSCKRKELPQPIIGICGCMAERLGSELTKGNHRVDLVVGVDRYDQLPALLKPMLAPQQGVPAVAIGHADEARLVAPPELYPMNNSHLVTIHKGCDYKCTYCIVPATRGPQCDKPADVIIKEIQNIVEIGGREVTLLGQNVTAYRGTDSGFAGLLKMVAKVDGIQRIRFLTGHPCDMDHHLIDTIGELLAVCPWIHLPVQSGSDRVLRRMKRYYTSGEYLDIINYARANIAGVTFSSDFIVGFPGETEEDFSATLELVKAVQYDQIFSFKYSERPGVPAVKLGDDVSTEEKKQRLARLMKTQESVWSEMAGACAGQLWPGVIERPARKPRTAWQMRTANNRKVIVEKDGLKEGDQINAIITGYRNTTFFGKVQDCS